MLDKEMTEAVASETPAEVIVEEAVAEAPAESPDMQAARYLQTAIPQFKMMVDRYEGSGAQLRNVLKCIAEHPMNQMPFHFGYPEEKDLFDAMDAISSAKLILLSYQIDAEKQKLKEKEAENGNG